MLAPAYGHLIASYLGQSLSSSVRKVISLPANLVAEIEAIAGDRNKFVGAVVRLLGRTVRFDSIPHVRRVQSS
jgi:hypothetical protein